MILNIYGWFFTLLHKYSLYLALILASTVFIFTLVTRWGVVFSYFPDIAGIEPNVIYSIQQIMAGKDLYSDPEAPPFAITQYSPFYYYLSACIAWLCNLNSVENVYEIYVIGRLLSLIFNILTAIVIFLIIYTIFSIDWKIAVIGGISSFIYQYTWNCAVRPDSMLSFFIILSVFYFLKYLKEIQEDKTEINSYLILAVIVSVISIFIKQSGIQLPIILFSFLLFMRLWKALLLSFTLASTLLILLNVFFYYTYGSAFFKNIIGGINNGIDLYWFIKWILYNKVFLLELILFATVFSIYISTFLKESTIFIKFVSYCAMAMFAFATITALKYGSTIQYYVDFQNISILVLSIYFLSKESSHGNSINSTTQISFFIFTTAILLMGIVYVYLSLGKFNRGNKESKTIYEQQKSIANYLKSTLQIKKDEYIFVYSDSSLVIGTFLGNFLHHNYAMPQKDIVTCCSYPRKVFDYSIFRSYVDTGKIKYFIINREHKNQYSNTIVGATFKKYTHFFDKEGYSIFIHEKYNKK